ncbi:MAG: thrombospondin type 3 repeat-containing protein [Candidatus Heimdallarchaeota archaeon]
MGVGLQVRKRVLVGLIILNCIFISFSFNTKKSAASSSGVNSDWELQTHSDLDSSPTFVNVNNDWNLDIIVSSSDGLFCTDHNGELIWNFTRELSNFYSPIITDLNADNEIEIIATSKSLGVFCFATNGTSLWNYSKQNIRTPACIGDINNDNYMEILVGSADDLICLDYQGLLLWNFSTPVYPTHAITLVDLYNDQDIEILVGCEINKLFCLFSNGTVFWSIDGVYGETIIIDLDFNDLPDILLADFNRVVRLNATGDIQWEYYGGMDLHSLCAADVMGHATPEIFFCSSNDYSVRCIDWQGDFKWAYFLVDDPESIAVIKADTRSSFEIIVSTHNSKFYSISPSGTIYWQYYYSSNYAAANFCVIDLERDGLLEIVFTSHRSLYCLRLTHENNLPYLHPWYSSDGTVFGTRNWDSDSDLIDDLTENTWFKSDANNPDSDADGLLDGEEFLLYRTNMSNPDTDGDGFLDGEEVDTGTNPLDATDYPKRKIILTIVLSVLGFVALLTIIILSISISKAKKS